MKKYFVYIVQCKDGSYYTGITNNVDLRINQHNEGADSKCYTYSRRPVVLKFVAEFTNVLHAIEIEKQIKGWTRKKKEAIIQGNWEALKLLSECKNETYYKNKKP